MRFVVLTLAAVITGAVSVASFTRFFPEQRAGIAATIRAAEAEIAQFHLSDLNPLWWDYDYVLRQAASSDRKLDFPVSAAVVVDQSKMLSAFGANQTSFGSGLSISNNAQNRLHSTTPPRR